MTDLTFTKPRLSTMVPNCIVRDDTPRRAWFYVTGRTNEGVRVARRISNLADTDWLTPTFTDFVDHACIVDGSDGKVYILTHSRHSTLVTILTSDMAHYIRAVFVGDDDYDDLAALITQAKGGKS